MVPDAKPKFALDSSLVGEDGNHRGARARAAWNAHSGIQGVPSGLQGITHQRNIANARSRLQGPPRAFLDFHVRGVTGQHHIAHPQACHFSNACPRG